MMTLSILTGTENPTLRTPSTAVLRIDASVRTLLSQMRETLAQSGGVGLAAPQVGKNRRILLAALRRETTPVAMINPKIVCASDETAIFEEGCLSLPNEWHEVERPAAIVVEFLNEKGTTQRLRLSGFGARVVEHEIDHLDGILFIDRIFPKTASTRQKTEIEI